MLYGIIFKHGMACCETPDMVANLALHTEKVEIKSFNDIRRAYCWCCYHSVERRLQRGNQMPPLLPRLFDLQMNAAYFEPGYGRAESLPYARYFGAVSGDYAGVFTALSNVREFLAQFKGGQICEFDDEDAAKKWVADFYYRMLYPATAYIASGYFPAPLIYNVDCVYDFGYSTWLGQNISDDSPFQQLPGGEN